MWERILEDRILVAATVPRVDWATPLARALLEGGLRVMEVTFRNPEAAACIARIREQAPEMCVGAGTLLSAQNVSDAVAAGARFGVTPGFNPRVIDAARERGLPLIPGTMTPGEMEQALDLGCPVVKFFPAEAAGGTKFLSSLGGPYGHTPLRVIPLGGIGPTNLQAYLRIPLVGAVGGSWIADARLMAGGQWPGITAMAREALALARAAREQTAPK